MDVLVYDDRDKRYVPLLMALCFALLTSAIVGGLSYELGQAQQPETLVGVTEPQAGAVEAPTCAPAIERADAALGLGGRLDAALAQHSSVVDELRNESVTSEEAVERLPALSATTEERQAFLNAVREYERVRVGCLQ